MSLANVTAAILASVGFMKSGESDSSPVLGTPGLIAMPYAPPFDASPIVNHTYASFSIEGASFADFTGNASVPNNFSRNLIGAISGKLKFPLTIRVGGSSLDHSKFNPDQKVAVKRPKDQQESNVPLNVTLGPSWFEGFALFPEIRWTLTIPFADSTVDQSVDFAQRGVNAIQIENLDSLELGNEPNLYPDQDRPGLTPGSYVDIWRKTANTIAQKVKLPEGPIWTALSLANSNQSTWNVQSLTSGNLAHDGDIKYISQHFAQDGGDVIVEGTLMNHTDTTTKLDEFKGDIEFLRTTYGNMQYQLGQVSPRDPSLQSSNQTNDNLFGSQLSGALWLIDAAMHAACLGVSGFFTEMATNLGSSAWQPVKTAFSEPHVNPIFYAHLFLADIVGRRHNKPGDNPQIKIAPIANASAVSPNLSGYAVWRQGALSDLALVQLEPWSSKARPKATRPWYNITIAVPDGTTHVNVSRLTAPQGSVADGSAISYQGYNYDSTGMPVLIRTGTSSLSPIGGNVHVIIKASEALKVSFRRR